MKHFFLCLLIALPSLLSAQTDPTEGTIIYDNQISIQIDESQIPPEMQDMVKQMPKEHHFPRIMKYTKDESLFQNMPQEEEVVAEEGGPFGRMRQYMARENDANYMNLKDKEEIEKTEFFGRVFLVTDAPREVKWKMTGESKTILDFPCMKATTVIMDSVPVTAWFTPNIPVSMGPHGMGQLPGMILEMSMPQRSGPGGGATISWTATSIVFEKVSKSDLKKPKGGKVVTRDEYETIVAEKIEEMKKAWGGSHPRGGGARMMHH